MPYETLGCIISLHTNIRKKWSHTTNLLYNDKYIIGRLHKYFSAYFSTFPAPTAETLFLLVLSMLAMESADSIRSLYRHFLSGITLKSLNAFYYACSYAKANFSVFMNVTSRLALRLVPDSLQSQPVFLCIDDTMVSKFGTKFEDVSKLFDHAAHNGSNYPNGHCFVSIMLCVPVWNRQKVSYLAVPLGYRMWQKKESKLALAASMVRQVMPDSWIFWHICPCCPVTGNRLVSFDWLPQLIRNSILVKPANAPQAVSGLTRTPFLMQGN